MIKPVLLVRYAEIHLKGLNRPYFEQTLLRQIRRLVAPVEGAKAWKGDGRFYVAGYPEQLEERIQDEVCKICGVHSVSRAWAVEKDMEVIADTALELLEHEGMTRGGFKVDARRSDKQFPLNSMQINQELGGRMLEKLPELYVDIHHPSIVLACEIREEAYLYVGRKMAVGGMPVGTSGRAALLLSGGIDSPVAGYMLAKRGVELETIYFHSFPHTSELAKQKVQDLAQVLAGYAGRLPLNVVNFTAIQEYLYENGPDAMLTILMRRAMMRIAEKIARATQCQALATGESIAQVASQTMDALVVTGDAVDMPILQPLICFDKVETIELARKIGTYELSTLPYEDCCTVFTPRHPVTKPKLEKVKEAEARLTELPRMIEEAAASYEIINLYRKSII
jgi:thiamine biosynthesis protein ThiI